MTTLARACPRVRVSVADRLFLPYLTIHLTILAAVLCYPPYFWAAEHIFHICCFPCGIRNKETLKQETKWLQKLVLAISHLLFGRFVICFVLPPCDESTDPMGVSLYS